MSNIGSTIKTDAEDAKTWLQQIGRAAPMTAILVAFALGALLGHFL